MFTHASLLAGFLIGLAIAVPIGPMGLLCIQRTLAAGMAVGVSTGLGAATVNVFYGAAILAGLDTIGPWMTSGRRWISAMGGVFLLWTALRALRRRGRGSLRPGTAVRSPLGAYLSAVAFNATNPMALVLILALLSPVIGHGSPGLTGAAALLAGMFTAATAWWVCLSGGVALLRARLKPAVLAYVNQAAAVMLTIYGALALLRSTM